jgi:hypothetical protein
LVQADTSPVNHAASQRRSTVRIKTISATAKRPALRCKKAGQTVHRRRAGAKTAKMKHGKTKEQNA